MRKKTIGYARRLHLSFLLILLIPILVSFILYLYAVHQANEQSDRLHESLLSKVQADMDARLLSVRSVGSRLYIDSDVRALASVSGEMESSHAMAQVRLYQELNSLVLSSENLDGLFIYFPLTNKVISTNGNMDLSMFYSLYYENSALTEDAFHTLLSSDHRYDMHMLPAKGGSIQPLMLLSLPPDSSSTLAPIHRNALFSGNAAPAAGAGGICQYRNPLAASS